MPYHTLHLCYFGLREPLVQTQVLPYLREIQKDGIKISILTFETNPKENWTEIDIKSEKQKLADEGIDWHFLTYHKIPTVPATIYDVLNGAFFTWKYIRHKKPDIIHARVHVPALMGAIAKKFTRRKTKLLFDIRGFFPEEYTDAGRWKENGQIYKSVKRVEKWLLKESNGFVVLTEKAREILFPESKETGLDKIGRPIEVIPCCVNLSRFENFKDFDKTEQKRELGLENRRVITYVGSFGGWYLTDEMLSFFKTAKEYDNSTFALILTQSNPENLKEYLQKNGFNKSDFLIKKVAPSEIANYLSVADIAISFIKSCYSKLSSSPTKIAEYLACGIPIINSSGIGDVDQVIEEDRIGVVINDFSSETFIKALKEIDDLLKDDELALRCKMSAKKRFDLWEVGGKKYRSLYRRILNKV